MFYYKGGFFVFGGFNHDAKHGSPSSVTTIARFDEYRQSWKKVGDLFYGNYNHGLIYDGEDFLVIAGRSSVERCKINETEITCKHILWLDNPDPTVAFIDE